MSKHDIVLVCGAKANFAPLQRKTVLSIAGCSGCYVSKDTQGNVTGDSNDEHRVCPFFNGRGHLAPVGDQGLRDTFVSERSNLVL